MRGFRALDWILLAVLLPCWLGVFALHLRGTIQRSFVPPSAFVLPAPTPDQYPIIAGTWLNTPPSGDLRRGDEVLRAGDFDLAGSSVMSFPADVTAQTDPEGGVILEVVREGQRVQVPLKLATESIPWSRIPFVFSLGLVAVIVLVRSPGARDSRLFYAGMILISIGEATIWAQSRGAVMLSQYLFYTCIPVGITLLARWLIDFPPEVARQNRISRAWCWAITALWVIPRASYLAGGPIPTSVLPVLVYVSEAAVVGGLVAIMTWNFRHASPIGRRRVKWTACGAYIGALPVLVIWVLPTINERISWFPELIGLALIAGCAAPLGVLVGIIRFNLFDIDTLVSRTASLSVVGVLLIAALVGVLPMAAEVTAAAIGIQPTQAQMGLALVFAAVLVPVNRRLRPWVDRVFLAERQALERGAAELLSELGNSGDPEELMRHAGERIAQLFGPESCVIYSISNASYTPIFADGRAAVPAFEPDSPLIAALRRRGGPLALGDAEHSTESDLGPFDRAALETLEASLVLPVARHGELRGFLCLGPRRSGDVYTSTDLTLLAAVADKISSEQLRFDDADVIRREQAMAESLRRYVPEVIAERIEGGQDFEPGEREVSVLFADIRGYTTLVENLRADEIFSTVNRYTETVSQIIGQHGGSVIDFQGDGLMAVFGAPAELPQKEAAAVRAAREIVASVRTLQVAGDKLSVGVGVATGTAFVGNIQAADRMVWSAIGNTTNLAARLQGLTRELDTSIAICSATHAAAGSAASGFEVREHVPIRGRARAEDLYVLSLPG